MENLIETVYKTYEEAKKSAARELEIDVKHIKDQNKELLEALKDLKKKS